MPKCPRCRLEAKDTGRTWNYGVFQAKFFNCPACDKNFIAYYLDGKLSHTIPSVHNKQFEILKYLRAHGNAGLDELATALDLKLMDVLEVLIELEKKGEVESFLPK